MQKKVYLYLTNKEAIIENDFDSLVVKYAVYLYYDQN